MQTFSQILEIIENFISKEKFNTQLPGLYEPVDYILQLPAKRVRPAMMLMSYQLFKKDYTPLLPLAFALEGFHNFTLIHDDIMDQAPLRRGKPTVHQKFGLNSGILSGDVLLIHVYEYIRKYAPDGTLTEILSCFNKTAIEVCEGQQMDMDFEKKEEVSFDEYIKMIQFKTAVLLAASLKIGALAAGAKEVDCELAYQTGLNLGIAFQIQDDYLDIYGDNYKVGKQKAGDIIQGKKSAPFILALESMMGEEKQNFISFYDFKDLEPSLKINNVLQVYEKLEIPSKIIRIKNAFQDKALNSLESISVSNESKKEIRDLLNMLLDREM